jgi:gas vesicle protein
MKKAGDVIGAFLIGVAVGTVIGILYAPQSGEETRKVLSSKTQNITEELNQKFNSLKDEIEKLKNEAAKISNDLIVEFEKKFKGKDSTKEEKT